MFRTVGSLEDAQAVLHADVPQAHGLVHGGRQQELRFRPGQVQHIRGVALVGPVGRLLQHWALRIYACSGD